MLNNGKFFLPPPKDGSDFKELFKRLAAAGAGRPLGDDGFPAGPWTPELLAEAISQIDSNRAGVDLRTVQLWFQENEKGVSTANIRWLARIFGCDDPTATSEWQMELSEAQSRLTARRREGRKAGSSVAIGDPDIAQAATANDQIAPSARPARDADALKLRPHLGLAMRSEALFSSGSPLNLPAAVFAGATALGFLSYITGVHSATYDRLDGVAKQVGFLWAPNWTLVFMVLLPLLFTFVTEVLVFWKLEGRLCLAAHCDRVESMDAWSHNVASSSATFWAVFLVCLVFAGVFQWIEVCLIPLIGGEGDYYATDWAKMAIVRPEITTVPEAILFTGFSYLYMSVCFYIFFVGLILLYTIAYDFQKISERLKASKVVDHRNEMAEVGLKLMNAIFRCAILGTLVAICMKVQSSYLTSPDQNIVAWLIKDMSSAFHDRKYVSEEGGFVMPTHYSSLLIVTSSCIVFLFGSVRINAGRHSRARLRKMSAIVFLLVAGYLLIGTFTGFSILLSVGVLGPVDKVDSQISRSVIQDCFLGGSFGSRRPDRYGMADHRGVVAHRTRQEVPTVAR
nr:hypothetical protein [Shinella sp. HZN7]